MCLALPARVMALHEDEHATVDLGGVRRCINVILVDDLRLDDYVLLHVGFAIGKLNAEEARRTLRLIEEALISTACTKPKRPWPSGHRGATAQFPVVSC